MNSSSFELTVSVPHDPRFAPVVRRVAEHAAHYAGYAGGDAEAFGRSVEEAIRGCMASTPINGNLPVVVRCAAGPVEIVVNGRALVLER